jgi:hypothetical protein
LSNNPPVVVVVGGGGGGGRSDAACEEDDDDNNNDVGVLHGRCRSSSSVVLVASPSADVDGIVRRWEVEISVVRVGWMRVRRDMPPAAAMGAAVTNDVMDLVM